MESDLLSGSTELREYRFRINLGTRWAALLYVWFIIFPKRCFNCLLHPNLDRLLCNLILGPLFGIKRVLVNLVSIFPLSPFLEYTVRLYDQHFAFGLEESLMANSYSVVEDIFRIGRRQVALLHDGWIVFLPMSPEGEVVVDHLRRRKGKR